MKTATTGEKKKRGRKALAVQQDMWLGWMKKENGAIMIAPDIQLRAPQEWWKSP